MQESVIFNSIVLLVLYGAALFLALVGMGNKKNCYLEVAAAFIAVATSAYAVLFGASLFEVALVVMVFLLIEIVSLGRKEK